MKRERIDKGIYKLESGRFQAVRQAPTPDGGRRTISESADTEAAAGRALKRIDAAIRAKQVAADPKLKVRTLVEKAIEHGVTLGNIAPRTEARYRELMERHVYPFVGDVKLEKLTAVRLQSVVDRMVKAGRDPEQTFAVLRRALRLAVKWQILPHSPAAGVELPTRRRTEQTLPTRGELARLLSGAGEPTEPFRAALTIAAACGLRRSEIVGLRWSEVDLTERLIHVRRGVHAVRRPEGGTELIEQAPKSERSARSVEVPPAAVKLLERYKAAQTERRVFLGGAWAEGWVAPDVVIDDGLGRPMHPDVFSRRFARLRKRLGVRPEVRLHDLRALYVTEAIAAGVDAGIVSRQAGHATADFTRDVYQRARREDARAAADAIENAYGDTFGGPFVAPVLLSDSSDVVELRGDHA